MNSKSLFHKGDLDDVGFRARVRAAAPRRDRGDVAVGMVGVLDGITDDLELGRSALRVPRGKWLRIL